VEEEKTEEEFFKRLKEIEELNLSGMEKSCLELASIIEFKELPSYEELKNTILESKKNGL